MSESDIVHVKCVLCGSTFMCDKSSLTGPVQKIGHGFNSIDTDGTEVRFGAVNPKGDICPFCALTALAEEVKVFLLKIGDIMATPCTEEGKNLNGL